MTNRIRALVGVVAVLFGVLFVQLNLTQLARGETYREHPLNTRDVERAFDRERGPIVTTDGEVIAVTVPSEGEFSHLRTYPDAELYAHVTGFLSLAYGADGLEAEWNDELAGATTRQQLGSWSALFDTEPRTATVTTTLHSGLQAAARDALGDRDGSVVVLDPRSGDVLALWSHPSYDPNELSAHDLAAVAEARTRLLADPDNPLRARSFRELYAPGSTFKTVVSVAALRSGRYTPDEPVLEEVEEYLPPLTDNPITNFGGTSCGGDLSDALRVSCNTWFAEVGVDLGADLIADAAADTGFGRPPPIGLPDPVASVFPDPEEFERATPLLAQASLGQYDVRATPLQMALVAAGIANDGTVMVPRIVSSVRSDDGELDDVSPATWRRAMSRSDAATMRELMAEVATAGTARRLLPPGVTGGGKTGTAELGTGDDATHAWIIGFAPLEAPTIAIAVLVEGGPDTGQQTGGAVAAPVANAVLTRAVELGLLG